MRPRSSVLLGLCAAIVLGLLTATITRAGSPTYLQAEDQTISTSPFQAALADGAATLPSGIGRYLGRAGHSDPQQSVIFADREHPRSGTISPPWGHGVIEQVQYPLTYPLPDRAPDQPPVLSPTPSEELGCAEHPSLVTMGETWVELTSVLGSGNSLGFTTLGLRTVIESPRLPGFSLRPIFGMHMLSGPTSTDLPGQIYDVSLEARMYYPFGDRWLGEFAIAPGIYTDFHNTSNSLRIVGRGIGYFKWTDKLRLAIGLAYLDRRDISYLPLGGIIWTPNDEWRYELLIPRPRIAHRFWSQGERERWGYLQGEFGGGSWAIQRSNGADDHVIYRDYRLLLGMEFKQPGGRAWLLEAGYAFGRQVQYQSTIGDYNPSPTAVVRAALTF